MRTLLTGFVLLMACMLSGCLLQREDEERKEYTAEIEFIGSELHDSVSVTLCRVCDTERPETLPGWVSFPQTEGETFSYFFLSRGVRTLQVRMFSGGSDTLMSQKFSVNPWRKNFVAMMGAEGLEIRSRDHLFPVKDSMAKSRWVFLVLFMTFKILSALLLYATGWFPWKVFPSFIGAFLFSTILTWHVPLAAIGLFVLCSWSEGALIFISNRRNISMIKTSMVVTGSNLASFGVTHLLYSVYYLW